MHPRSCYNKAPDFKQLSIDYPEFRKFVSLDVSGRISVDFKNPAALRALTRSLLHKDFGLDIEIPPGNLIPTVPQRFNYLLWVEDLLEILSDKNTPNIIDIGTGPCCIFPLIGSKKFGWNFIASEVNSNAVKFAVENVAKNGLDSKIKVMKVEKESCLYELVQDSNFSLSMCNPPFFKDVNDANWEQKSRTKKRTAPKSTNSATDEEKMIDGGEVAFVIRMITDSMKLKEKIRIYTTMLGKKSSLKFIMEELKRRMITQFTVTEFIQGKTTRWGVAWTFLPNLNLKKTQVQLHKEIAPVSYFIPSTIKETDYTLNAIMSKILYLLDELKIKSEKVEESCSTVCRYRLSAKENTWSHQRRKRREEARSQMGIVAQNNGETEEPQTSSSEPIAEAQSKSISKEIHPNPKRKFEEITGQNGSVSNSVRNCKKPKHQDLGELNGGTAEPEVIMESFLNLKVFGANIVLELIGIFAVNKDMFHQMMQFFKNRIK